MITIDYELLKEQYDALLRLAPATRAKDQGKIAGVIELIEALLDAHEDGTAEIRECAAMTRRNDQRRND